MQLVARRQASFDQSPLNVCKLRSLYRTLLTIDFAARTEERPNPARNYTEDEWYAYRKLQHGTRENEAHEVMDIYWLSPFVSVLANHRLALEKAKDRMTNVLVGPSCFMCP